MSDKPIPAENPEIPELDQADFENIFADSLPPPDLRDEEIAQLKQDLADMRDRMLRNAADADNTRRRVEREKAEATLYAATNFARDLLSVADNLARALQAADTDTLDPQSLQVIEGVEVTERELMQIFQRHGIQRLDPHGEKFDPNMHQAIFEVPTDKFPPGHVAEVMQDGYAIGERCLRPAMVGIAKAVEA